MRHLLAAPRLPPAARHPAAGPVRRRRLPGGARRHGAVQPPAGGRPRRRRRRASPSCCCPYSLVGPFAGRLAGPVEPPSGAAAGQPAARRPGGRRRGAGRSAACRGRRSTRPGWPSSRSTGSSSPRCRPALPHTTDDASLVSANALSTTSGRGRDRRRAAARRIGLLQLDRLGRRRLRGAGAGGGAALPRRRGGGRRVRPRATSAPTTVDRSAPAVGRRRRAGAWSPARGTSWALPPAAAALLAISLHRLCVRRPRR